MSNPGLKEEPLLSVADEYQVRPSRGTSRSTKAIIVALVNALLVAFVALALSIVAIIQSNQTSPNTVPPNSEIYSPKITYPTIVDPVIEGGTISSSTWSQTLIERPIINDAILNQPIIDTPTFSGIIMSPTFSNPTFQGNVATGPSIQVKGYESTIRLVATGESTIEDFSAISSRQIEVSNYFSAEFAVINTGEFGKVKVGELHSEFGTVSARKFVGISEADFYKISGSELSFGSGRITRITLGASMSGPEAEVTIRNLFCSEASAGILRVSHGIIAKDAGITVSEMWVSSVYYSGGLYYQPSANSIDLDLDHDEPEKTLKLFSKINLQSANPMRESPRLNVHQMQRVFPEAVQRVPEGNSTALAIDVTAVQDKMVSGIKGLIRRTELLKEENTRLRSHIATLEQRLETLEKQVLNQRQS